MAELAHGNPAIVVDDYGGNHAIVAVSGETYTVEIFLADGGEVRIRGSDSVGIEKIKALFDRKYSAPDSVDPEILLMPHQRPLGCIIALIHEVEGGYRIVQLEKPEDAAVVISVLNDILEKWRPSLGIRFLEVRISER